MFEIIAVDSEIALKGGLYRRDYRKSHDLGLADALIAATAKSCHASLVTLNSKHFPMLTDVIVPYRKSESLRPRRSTTNETDRPP